MNRMKALCIHEMRSMRWILLVGVVCVCIFLTALSSKVNNYCSYAGLNFIEEVNKFDYVELTGGQSIFSTAFTLVLRNAHIAAILLLALFVNLQFSDFHKKKEDEFISSLPIKGIYRCLMKIFLGYGLITFCCILAGIGVFRIRDEYMEEFSKHALVSSAYKGLLANETPWHTLRSLLMFWLILIVVYTVYVAIHNMVNRGVLATIIGMGIMMVGPWICVVNQYISSMTGGYKLFDEEQSFCCLFWGLHTSTQTRGLFMEQEYSWFDSEGGVHLISYYSYVLPVIFSLVVGISCFIFAVMASKKREGSRYDILVPTVFPRMLFAAGIAVCISVTVAMSFHMLYSSFVVFAMVSIVLSVPLFIVYMKAFAGNRKGGRRS